MIPWYAGSVHLLLMSAQISSYVASLPSLHVRSTTETSGVGTRNAMPVSLPLRAGMTLPTALAAPVDDGMMFCPAPRPPRQSLPDGPSTVFCVAVVACTVVIRPSLMVYASWMIFTSGARQLVVHDAFERMFTSFVYVVWFTPITNIGASADGAEMITFLAPPFRCAEALSMVVKIPVDSHTMSAPDAPHGTSSGLRTAKNLIDCLSTLRMLFASSHETS